MDTPLTSQPQFTKFPATDSQVRNVRVRMPDYLYRRLKHELADSGPATTLSDIIVSVLDQNLSALG